MEKTFATHKLDQEINNNNNNNKKNTFNSIIRKSNKDKVKCMNRHFQKEDLQTVERELRRQSISLTIEKIKSQ